MLRTFKIHPIYILHSIKQFIFLLIIPLSRGLIYYTINSNIYAWVKGSWIDIFIFMTILVLSIIRWYNYVISFNNNIIVISSGIFIKKKFFINKNNIFFVSTHIPFYYKPINAIKVNLYTCDKSKLVANPDIVMSKSNFKFFESTYLYDIPKIKNHKKNFSFITTLHTVLLSLITSNSFAGIILVSTFISNASKILGSQLEKEIYGRFTFLTKKLAFGFPPAGAAIAYILIIGWFIAFIRNLIIYLNFYCFRKNNILVTSCGLLNSELDFTILEDINYIDIVQNIFTKIMDICSVFIDVPNNKNSKIVVIPAIGVEKLECNINKIFDKNINNLKKSNFTPPLNSIFSYITFPIILFIFIFYFANILIKSYPNWFDFISFMIFMSFIVTLWFLLVKIINFFTCGLSIQNGNYIIKYSVLFKFHTVIIPINKVSKIDFSQNLFQKYAKTCHLNVYSFFNTHSSHKIKNIDENILKNFFNID